VRYQNTVDPYFAVQVRLIDTRHDFHEGALSGTILTGNGEHLATSDVQAYPIQSLYTREGL
jgi:hypothetical protein